MLDLSSLNVTLPTMMRTHVKDGLLIGTDGSVWLARKAPLFPIADARSTEKKDQAFAPLMQAFQGLQEISPTYQKRRNLAQKKYRECQLKLVQTNRPFRTQHAHPLRDYLEGHFPQQAVPDRMVLLFVRLTMKPGGQGASFAAMVASVAEALAQNTTPLQDFEWDRERVDAILTDAGFTIPTAHDIRVSDSWWNQGTFPDVIMLPHAEHLHIFKDEPSAAAADHAGRKDCSDWPESLTGSASRRTGHQMITFATVEGFKFDGFPTADTDEANWMADLLRADLLAASVRFFIEPAQITREELRRAQTRQKHDIEDRSKTTKADRIEQFDEYQKLEAVENMYARGALSAPPTFVKTSILVAFNGHVEDVERATSWNAARLRPMSGRQRQALAEMMICSSVRSNPNLLDVPAQTIGCAGFNSLSYVGDKTGALVGFTERDRQPAYLDPTRSSNEDSLPFSINIGGTGSGKTQLLLWKATQYALMGYPSVILDPKTNSHHDPTVLAFGGTVYSLDELTKSDGAFDPLRFSKNPHVGMQLATSVLRSIYPWPPGATGHNWEVELMEALNVGVEAGATCTGQALELAAGRLGERSRPLIEPILKLTEISPSFRAIVGRTPQGAALSVADGLTLIKVGDSRLELPEPGTAPESMSIPQRVDLALVRMMVFGTAMALNGRRGTIHLDEAWVFLGAGRSEIDQLGRLARSWGILPEFYTQRVTDALEANLAGFISRGFILPVQGDEKEARAACELFGLDQTPERITRLTSKRTLSDSEEGAPNWNSMHALFSEYEVPGPDGRPVKKKRVERGAIGIYCDFDGRVIPTEVVLPKAFLDKSSTNVKDVEERARSAA